MDGTYTYHAQPSNLRKTKQRSWSWQKNSGEKFHKRNEAQHTNTAARATPSQYTPSSYDTHSLNRANTKFESAFDPWPTNKEIEDLDCLLENDEFSLHLVIANFLENLDYLLESHVCEQQSFIDLAIPKLELVGCKARHLGFDVELMLPYMRFRDSIEGKGDLLFPFIPRIINENFHFTITSETVNLSDRRYLRRTRQGKLSRWHAQDFESANESLRKLIIKDTDGFSQLPIFCHDYVTKWKNGAGRKKGWKISSFTDLSKMYNQLYSEWQKRKYTSPRAAVQPTLDTLGLCTFAAARAVNIPKIMLKKHRCKQNTSGLTSSLYIPHDIERKFKAGCKDSKAHSLKFPRKGKRNSQIEVKETIRDGISLQRSPSLSEFEIFNADIENGDTCESGMSTQSRISENLTCKNEMKDKIDQCASIALTIPYESHIGTVIGSRFILRGFVCSKICYDLHVAEGLNTGMKYIAKAFAIHGTKDKERGSRVKNLKRNFAKTSCVASIDQNGKKWLFFLASSHSDIEDDVSPNPLIWLGKQQYQRHFPSLSPCRITSPTGQKPLLMSYADCVRKAQVGTKNRFTDKRQRARERQRRKRKEARAAKAAMRENLEGKKGSLKENRNLPEELRFSQTCEEERITQRGAEEIQDEQGPQNSQEQSKGILTFPGAHFDSIAGAHDSDVASSTGLSNGSSAKAPGVGSEGGSPGQEAHPPKHQHHPINHPIFTPDPNSFDSDAFERCLQALDKTMGYDHYHDVDQGLWQQLISGPAMSFKNRFFEILERRREDFDIMMDTAVSSERKSAEARKPLDFFVISRFLHAAMLNRAYNLYPQSESAAFESLLQTFCSGDIDGSIAMQSLCESGNNQVIPTEGLGIPNLDPVTCEAHLNASFTELIGLQTA